MTEGLGLAVVSAIPLLSGGLLEQLRGLRRQRGLDRLANIS